jgi:hypothetical protein
MSPYNVHFHRETSIVGTQGRYTMKIWYNQTLPGQASTNDDCDDDCAPPDTPAREILEHHSSGQLSNNGDSHFNACKDHSFSAQGCSCSPSNEAIQQASSLHMQSLASGQTFVCNPTGSGCIAVLDEEALELLEQVRVPISIYQVLSMYSEERSEAIRSAIATFHSLGFLSDERRSPDQAGAMLNHQIAIFIWPSSLMFSAWKLCACLPTHLPSHFK